ncbi:6-phosphogluconolactonase [Mucilaginibacter sp. L3T2-6]|uniref:6-phosphogluconolactonase n=1 Tax=Mucilaginibacter sp. L3T2-6 TaxID=3062491 RepID=UPI0026760CAF|nr:glucosamine-6-phosphate deaminase [Mucilaginibacter sp. L3T2-6]MDO3642161.1 glucosamine-6-phosphate deaminase [Mucilaginibacter sp. L3T2-6]MDV6214656.1 glucosamine-6-phosphate deaminase [Mucilaginibacter sp. L3T2-6]
MKTFIHKNYDEMCHAAADIIVNQIKQKPDSLICLTSGDTPAGIYRLLVQYAKEGKVDFSRTWFVGLDEWVGMDKNDAGSCTNFLYETFFTPANIHPSQMMVFDAKTADLDASCTAMNNFIKEHGPLAIMLVGVGMNGHIGLNEPGADFNAYAHHSPLDPITVEVGQKYFQSETKLTEGITLGLRHLQEAGIPMLLASGAKKADIIGKALQGEVTNQVPASIFQTLPHGYVMLDEDAATKLVHS